VVPILQKGLFFHSFYFPFFRLLSPFVFVLVGLDGA
jgi:hypothetical protein